MQIKDACGQEWVVLRLRQPWRRVVQLSMSVFQYAPYRVRPPEQKPGVLGRAVERRDARRAQRAEKRENRRISGWHWLYLGPILALAVVFGQFLELLQLIPMVIIAAIWLVLLPFALAEILVRWVISLGLTALRLTGAIRSRVDVVAHHQKSKRIGSLTVLLVPGAGNANRLVQALAERQSRANRPFDPVRDHEVAGILAAHGVEVRQHASLLEYPPSVAAPAGPGVRQPEAR